MEERVKTTAKIPTDLWKMTKKQCVDEGIDMADAINDGLRLWLEAQRKTLKANRA